LGGRAGQRGKPVEQRLHHGDGLVAAQFAGPDGGLDYPRRRIDLDL